MFPLRRRSMFAALPTLALARPALATWPEQAIRLITPFPPGATSDSAARGIAQVLSQGYQRSVVVDNRPGAGGGIGAQQALSARPDGYTLLLVNNAVLSMVPRLSEVKFDPTRDFAPVAFLGDSYNLLAISPHLAVQDFAGFVRLVREHPGEFVYASPGVGSYGHVAGAMLQRRLGLEMLHAPFNGIVPAINAVLAGHAHAVMGPNTLPFAQSGNLRGIAVIGSHRWPDLAGVPTLPELGLADWSLDFWYAVVAPAGTPLERRQKLQVDFAAAMRTPAVGPLLERVGLRLAERSLDEIGDTIARDWSTMGEALKAVDLG
ncbi:tripartite tricarboxylate transporter substrate binding protein [Roseomonas sp. KE2513]|uniref:Bug family tripartite tricarboxylate transporter substrate binding protein n=1 Tax=Roseomonas sp. KE2513 TaxID=2479202 RepID=UPI0018E06138|nr:tripartite tricarboxylate transporter substrate binding protein [Roseomonas sp. KE2513]MBI0538537.1 tripartite tricarboxylate transporter substrate binding protein [Roseomonas sp. KE2513]